MPQKTGQKFINTIDRQFSGRVECFLGFDQLNDKLPGGNQVFLSLFILVPVDEPVAWQESKGKS